MALVSSFAALLAVLGLVPAIPLGFVPAPITLQTLGVMLAGSLLGWRRAMLAVLLFLALVAVGFPLLAGGRGGLGVFAGPTVGYLVGFVVGAGVTGALVERRLPSYTAAWGGFANVVGGVLVVHLCGIVGLATAAGMAPARAALVDLVFLPGDLLKAVLATAAALAVHRGYPGVVEPRHGRESERPVG